MLDRALIEAIEEVVDEAKQPKSVATRLTAWLTRPAKKNLVRTTRHSFSLKFVTRWTWGIEMELILLDGKSEGLRSQT